MTWLAVTVAGASPHARETITAALIDAGAAGVQEDAGALVTWLPNDASLAAVHGAVATAPGATIDVREVPASEAERTWPTAVGITRVRNLAVTPPWLAGDVPVDCTPIIIEPAMAFGTGEHATTRGVLHLMHEVIAPGDVVADLGSGSAVLAIAAIHLGALRVAAIELDPDSIGNAEENVVANGVADRVIVIEGDARLLLPLVAPVRVILANIVSSVLVSLLDTMRSSLTADGVAILSGLLVDEMTDFTRALEAAGWRIRGEHVEETWWSIIAQPA